ncbi:MAG: HD domain-containing protein, partial [Lachnospiraceae bacterium]|nr:HD domain-containing protein [Candidatus Equihabitans merdae]
MKDRIAFRAEIEKVLSTIDPRILAYNENEMWMIHASYEYLEFYGFFNKLRNTAIALPLARGLHNDTYRKSTIKKGGETYRLPYVIHCLQVCKMLADLHMPLTNEEEDILLASALCHDLIEDYPFTDGGRELVTKYHLEPRVYETVKLVS